MKNSADALFFARELVHVGYIVSERKQIALMAFEKLHSQFSRRLLATSRSEMGISMKKIILGVCFMAAVFAFSSHSNAKVYHPGFSSTRITKPVYQRIKGKSYRKNKYISLSDLRYLRLRYYDYSGRIRQGEMIVNKRIAKSTVNVFYQLYQIKYPIQRMKLVDEYKADDDKSMRANNTSAFNFRMIGNTNKLSNHALGLAIDINPRINPCVGGAHGIAPANGKLYVQRNKKRCKGKFAANMIHKQDKAYRIFRKNGFKWGGNWKSMKDYQHFEKILDIGTEHVN